MVRSLHNTFYTIANYVHYLFLYLAFYSLVPEYPKDCEEIYFYFLKDIFSYKYHRLRVVSAPHICQSCQYRDS